MLTVMENVFLGLEPRTLGHTLGLEGDGPAHAGHPREDRR